MLCEAGRSMGYRVEAVHHATPVGPGRRSWAQVLFTRAASSDDLPMPTRIPFGEGDVLIGMDPVESLRALGPDPYLRIGAAGRTRACVNTGAFPDQLREPFESAAAALEPSIERTLGVPADLAIDMARRVRHAFLNDRVLDVAMLGASFQLGLVPVTVEALEAAARRM
jgi:Pyruvate/2-oxoacid:ferredoxin oxidoreductase gamma subunit